MSGKLNFQYRVSLSELEADKFVKAIKDACRKSLIKAARSFLLAAVPHVPIFTGFARGAFGNLEDVAGKVTSSNLLNPKGKGAKRVINYQKRKYYYYPTKGRRILRNNVTGRQFATPTDKIFSGGKARIAEADKVFFFKYSIDIKYFNYLDRAKWHSFESGYTAFNETLRSELDRLKPKIGKYLIKRELKK